MTSRRIRVVTLTDRFGPIGGAENLAAQIAMRLDPARFSSTLVATRWTDEDRRYPEINLAAEELRAAGVRVVGLERRDKWDLRAWGPFLNGTRRGGADVLHTHQFTSNVWGTLMGRIAAIPVIVAHEHTWSFEGQPLRKLLDRHLVARGASTVLAVSRADRQRMIEIERMPPDVVRYLPNGVPPSPRADARADVRAELGIADDVPLIVTVGTLRPQKRFDVFVDAMAVVRERHPQAVGVIVGGEYGDGRERLEEQIGRLGLADGVRLAGQRNDVPRLLSAVDIAVSSSDFEGMPLSILEYMAAGLPVAATAVGGVPDLITDGEHGLLVAKQDPAALAGAIGRLLDDPAAAAEMGARGARRREEEFDLDGMVRRVEDLYVELLGRR